MLLVISRWILKTPRVFWIPPSDHAILRFFFALGNHSVPVEDFPCQTDLVRVEPIALLPTQAGCAVFLGDGTKAIVFYIDPGVGASINASLSGQLPPRPLTHDLYLLTLEAFGAKVSRAVIVRMENEVYYARLILEAENEIMERKIIELDARPSDCLALVVRCGAPFYVVRGALGHAARHVRGARRDARETPRKRVAAGLRVSGDFQKSSACGGEDRF